MTLADRRKFLHMDRLLELKRFERYLSMPRLKAVKHIRVGEPAWIACLADFVPVCEDNPSFTLHKLIGLYKGVPVYVSEDLRKDECRISCHALRYEKLESLLIKA